jgi:hypothetical protein
MATTNSTSPTAQKALRDEATKFLAERGFNSDGQPDTEEVSARRSFSMRTTYYSAASHRPWIFDGRGSAEE